MESSIMPLYGVMLVCMIIQHCHCQITSMPASTEVPITTTDGKTGCILDKGEDAAKNRLAALQKTFEGDFKRQLDLIFLIDRSASIGKTEFNQTQFFINQLVSFLFERQYIFMHEDNTRVAVISFGKQASTDIDGIDADSHIDACILGKRIHEIPLHNEGTDQSELAQGLSASFDLFDFSRTNPDRSKAMQVLWVFFDGAEGNQSYYKGKTGQDWAIELKRVGVKVFSVGVGAWIHIAVERERRVQELASSGDRFACIGTWEKILNDASNFKPGSQMVASSFHEIADAYKSKCEETIGGSCPENLECACDVTSRQYGCSDVVIRSTEDGSRTNLGESNPWLLPVAIAAGIFGFMLLLILLIVVPVLSKKRREERRREQLYFDDQPIYSGPPLPPPPRRNRRINPNPEAVHNVYGNVVDQIKRTNSLSSQSSSEAGSEIQGIGQYQIIDYPQTTINYENVEVKLDEDMGEWPEYLFDKKNDKRLNHLTIRSIKNKCWAITPGFDITEKEVRELEKVMFHGSEYKGKKIKIAAKYYNLDFEEVSALHLHATRVNRKGISECAWVCKACDYVIVGVADGVQDDECCAAVYDIHRHLTQLIQGNGSHITGDSSRYYNLSLNRLSARFENSENRV